MPEINPIFKRKMYDVLSDWKNRYHGKRAALIEGARRVGKTTLVKQFAETEYDSYIYLDFTKLNPDTAKLFRGEAYDLDDFFNKLQFSEGKRLQRRKSLIIFDEVQLCPPARQMIKHLVEDGRYDYIETGSLISLKKNTEKIVIPSEEKHYSMHPMDFEEYLWARGDTEIIPMIRECFDQRKPVGEPYHRKIMRVYREYMMVGGMPSAVSAYLSTKDIFETDDVKRDILTIYGEDMEKIPSYTGIKASRIFNAIPTFLSNKVQYFSPGSIVADSRTRDYLGAIEWLNESKTVNLCKSTTDVSIFSQLYINENVFKCYMVDTGLLFSAAFPDGSEEMDYAYKSFLFGKLSSNLGMFYENMVAQELTCTGHELVFFQFKVGVKEEDQEKEDSVPEEKEALPKGKNHEIDFLISKGKKTLPIEVKSSKSTVHSSLDHMVDKYGERLGEKFVVHTKDLSVTDGITYIPIYMTMFL